MGYYEPDNAEWWTLQLVDRIKGKVYAEETHNNEEDAIKAGEGFWEAHQYKEESDLILTHHVRKEIVVRQWSVDAD